MRINKALIKRFQKIADRRDLNGLIGMLAKHPDTNLEALLCYFATRDFPEGMQYLIEQRQVELSSNSKCQPLFQAVEYGRVGNIAYLESLGVDITQDDGRALSLAVANKQHFVVDYFLKSGKFTKKKHLNDAMVESAINGFVVMARKLKAAGADINCYGGRPAREAAKRNRAEFLEWLGTQGADFSLHRGQAIVEAARTGSGQSVSVITKYAKPHPDNNYSSEFLIAGAREGNLLIVQKAIEAGISPDVLNGQALIDAIKGLHSDVVVYLVEEAGADVTLQDNRAIKESAEIGDHDFIGLLLRHRADWKAVSTYKGLANLLAYFGKDTAEGKIVMGKMYRLQMG